MKIKAPESIEVEYYYYCNKKYDPSTAILIKAGEEVETIDYGNYIEVRWHNSDNTLIRVSKLYIYSSNERIQLMKRGWIKNDKIYGILNK